MKATHPFFLLLCAQAVSLVLPVRSPGQTVSSPQASGSQPSGLQAQPLDFNSTQITAPTYAVSESTGVVSTNWHRYLKVGNGLNFVDGNGSLQPSQDRIDLQSDGSAAATYGRTKAYFSANLNTFGATTIVSTSNRVFQTHLLGLYFYDATSGNRALISGMQDCAAELVSPNQLVYKNGFQSIHADVRMTYTHGATESDVIMLEEPASPDAYGLSSTNGTIFLEVWHEYINPPTPQLRTRFLSSVTDPKLRSTMVSPDFVDQTLDFGELWYPLGRIYFMDEYLNTPTNVPAQIRIADPSDPNQIVVGKQWLVSPDGSRFFLVESVPWLSVKPQLDLLPKQGTGARLYRQRKGLIAKKFAVPPPKARRPKLQPVRLASAPYRPKGVCLDYITVSSGTDYTFSTGYTYYIDSSVSFSGTVTLQPNAVIKFGSGAYLLCYGSFSFNTDTNAAPTILTSKDDDLFGDQITGSTGVPTYMANPSIFIYYVSSGTGVTGVRVRWAQKGVEYTQGGAFDNSSVEISQTGLCSDDSNYTVNIDNSTMCGVSTPVNDTYAFYGSLTDICSGDSDGNGLPDVWEYKYFGQIGNNPSADPDGDGLSNFQEYIMGTNPAKAAVADTSGAIALQVYTPLK